MSLFKSVAIAASTIGLTFATPALADPIMLDSGDVGSSWTIDYNGFVDGNNVVDGLGSQTTFTLTGVSGNSYTFNYAIGNTTDSGVGSRLASFAFNTDPNITGVSSTGAYGFAFTNVNYPNQIGRVEACFQSVSNGSCTGNRGGLTAGQSGTGTLTLSFATLPTSLTLDDFFVRYQSVTGVAGITSASGAQTSTTTSGGSSGGTDVPEPGMMLMFGLAVLGFAYFRRRGFALPTLPRYTVSYA